MEVMAVTWLIVTKYPRTAVLVTQGPQMSMWPLFTVTRAELRRG